MRHNAREIVVDSFAGGGGASTGIEAAIGRSVDVAINHDAAAISLHEANHPATRHYCENVWDVDPREAAGGRPVGLLWASPDCFPAGTLVLTRRGYQPIEDIEVGDEVLTHKLRWRRVTDVYNTRKPLMLIKGHGHPGLLVSSEHPFYARHRRNVWRTDPRGYERTLEPADWVAASELDRGWYWAAPTEFPASDVPPIGGRGMEIDGRLMWLVGRYLGDGWTRLTQTRAEVVITCGKHEADGLRQMLSVWPRQNGRAERDELAWHERETGTAYQFATDHRGLVEWLREHFGHRAESKGVPAWALGMAPELRQALLDGYLSADGWSGPGFSECDTVSKSLAFGVKALLNSLGKTVIVHRSSNRGVIQGRQVNTRPVFKLRWRDEVDASHVQTFTEDGLEWCPIRSQAPAAVEADVFNIGVAEDESYIAEGIVVHNCTHFSKAKGGKPRKKEIRGLAWVVVRWAATVRPRVIMLENVEEFTTWGPLDHEGQPIKRQSGRIFATFIHALQRQGYRVEWRELRACDYGAPTIRKRFFLVARCDGEPIVWPAPTHGDPKSDAVKSGRLKPWRTAAEIIDWSLPCPSIFERKRPLAENTLRRIARGIQRFVIDNPQPFIVKVNHHSDDFRGQSVGEPIQTITAKNGWGVVTPTLIQTGYGEREGQAPRALDLGRPLGTVVAGGAKHALVAAFLASYHAPKSDTEARGALPSDPIRTVDTANRYSLVTSHLLKLRGTSRDGQTVDRPMPTITAGGTHVGEVRAFLIKYFGAGTGQACDEPLHTVTSKHRFGLVTVEGEEYQIVDIGMRMLEPHELFAAQGFRTSYIIDRGADGKRFSKAQQVALCGNAVPPQLATALVHANLPEMCGLANVQMTLEEATAGD